MEIIRSGYEGLRDHIVPMILQIEDEQLRERMNPAINPVIWMCWHLLIVEDMFLSDVVFREQQVFHADAWEEKIGNRHLRCRDRHGCFRSG